MLDLFLLFFVCLQNKRGNKKMRTITKLEKQKCIVGDFNECMLRCVNKLGYFASQSQSMWISSMKILFYNFKYPNYPTFIFERFFSLKHLIQKSCLDFNHVSLKSKMPIEYIKPFWIGAKNTTKKLTTFLYLTTRLQENERLFCEKIVVCLPKNRQK